MPRRRLSLTGTVISIRYPGHGDQPEVEVTLEVGTSILELVFLSRRDLKSVDIGQQIHVRGSVVRRRGVPTIFNPTYTIRPEEM